MKINIYQGRLIDISTKTNTLVLVQCALMLQASQRKSELCEVMKTVEEDRQELAAVSADLAARQQHILSLKSQKEAAHEKISQLKAALQVSISYSDLSARSPQSC